MRGLTELYEAGAAFCALFTNDDVWFECRMVIDDMIRMFVSALIG